MEKSRIIIGMILSLVGIALILIPLFVSFNISFIFLIYGVPIFVIGIIILFNNKEDVIEQINKTGGKKSK